MGNHGARKEFEGKVSLGVRQPKSLGEQSRLMRITCLLLLFGLPVAFVQAEPLFPTAEGTTWQYETTEELGGPGAAPPSTGSVTMRIGRQTFGGKEFIKRETMTGDAVTRTELMTFDEHGW